MITKVSTTEASTINTVGEDFGDHLLGQGAEHRSPESSFRSYDLDEILPFPVLVAHAVRHHPVFVPGHEPRFPFRSPDAVKLVVNL